MAVKVYSIPLEFTLRLEGLATGPQSKNEKYEHLSR